MLGKSTKYRTPRNVTRNGRRFLTRAIILSEKHDSCNDAGSSATIQKSGMSRTKYWAEPPEGKPGKGEYPRFLLTCRSLVSVSGADETDAINDGGATAAVIGSSEYHRLAEEMELKLKLEELLPNDCTWHAFGVHDKISVAEPIIGVTYIPIPCGRDRLLNVRTLVVESKVSFVVSKPTL